MGSIRLPKFGLLAAGTLLVSLGVAYVVQHREGYSDTPIIPGQKWHVHDPARPYPHEVTPGTNLGDAPSDAIVLFDGKDLSHFCQFAKGDDTTDPLEPKWKIVDGTIEVAGGTGSLFTRDKFGDCQLHVEWREDPNITGSGQGRGNSGVFLQNRYEVQVLDSYHSATYADGQAGALYGQWPPMDNPLRKPGEWQAYDIMFHAPKFQGNKVVQPAYITVLINGVLVHEHQKLNGPTAHRSVEPEEVHGPDRLSLQDHGPREPLRFRNIWIRPLHDYDQPETN